MQERSSVQLDRDTHRATKLLSAFLGCSIKDLMDKLVRKEISERGLEEKIFQV